MPKEQRFTVKYDHGGHEHGGTYAIDDGMVTVHYQGRTKCTQIGGLTAEHFAGMLLSEMVRGLPD